MVVMALLALPSRLAPELGPAPAQALSLLPPAPAAAPDLAPQSAGPDFTLAVSPTVQTISSGDRARYVVTVTSVEGFSGAVKLSVPRVPQRAIARFPRDVITPTTEAEFFLETTVATAPGARTSSPRRDRRPSAAAPSRR